MEFIKKLSSSAEPLGIGKPSHPVARRKDIKLRNKLKTIVLFSFYFNDLYTPLSTARGIK